MRPSGRFWKADVSFAHGRNVYNYCPESGLCWFAYFQIFWQSPRQLRRDLCPFSLNLGWTSWHQVDTMLSDSTKLRLGLKKPRSFCVLLFRHTLLEPWATTSGVWLTWEHHALQKPKPQTCEERYVLGIPAPRTGAAPAFQSSILRSQTSWRRDRTSLLCLVCIFEPQHLWS